MSAAALPQDALLPRAPGGMAPGAAAAVLVHAGLIAALTLGIDWRSREPDTVVAELWSALPQSAAPPPEVAPPPPPAPAPAPTPAPAPAVKPAAQPDADIALERERRQKAEQKKAEDEKRRLEAEAEKKRKADEKKAEDERKKREAAEAARVAEEKAEDARIEKQRQENLRRMMGMAGSAATPGTGTAPQSSGPSANYLARLRKQVRDAVSFTGTVPDSATTEVAVTTAAGGTILSIRVLKSSGYKDWDDAVVRGLEKLGSLTRDTDGRVPPSLTLVFRRND